MSRPVLGRGLGELMQGQPATGSPDAAPTSSEPRATPSPGVERLVQQRPEAQAPYSWSLQAHERAVLVRRALWTGDVALTGMAAWFGFRHGAALGAMDLVLCTAAVVVGATLGVLALVLDAEEEPPRETPGCEAAGRRP